jgi:hypothetical protein
MEGLYGLLADLVVGIHVGYVAFVIVGQVLIWAGWALGWRWVRNFWFRAVHLVMIGAVVFEELSGIRCPLTVWEEALRELAGQPVTGESFLGRALHWMLFYEAPGWMFRVGYLTTGALVLGTFVLCPPRRPFGRRRGRLAQMRGPTRA